MQLWQDDLRGRTHVGVPDRTAGPGSGRARPGTGREGCGDRGAAPPAGGAAPAGCPAPLHPDRPDAARDAGTAAAVGTLAAVPGHPFDAAALAPRAGTPPLDLPVGRTTGSPVSARGRGRTHRAAGPGEPPLGLPAHRRGVPQARRHRLGDLGPLDPAVTPARPGAPPRRAELGAVPPSASYRGDRV